jgi:serine/threonine protein kinase
MRGESMFKHLIENGPMDDASTKAIAKQLFAGLAHMHGRSIAHPDIKTGDLLWDRHDNHLHIIDLGMAEKLPVTKPYYAEYCTEPYRPPELWDAAEVDLPRYLGPPVDIWSAGCVMYEVTTAKVLFLPASRKQTSSSMVRTWCTSFGHLARGMQPMSEGGEAMHVALLRVPPVWHKRVLRCCYPEPEQRAAPDLGRC